MNGSVVFDLLRFPLYVSTINVFDTTIVIGEVKPTLHFFFFFFFFFFFLLLLFLFIFSSFIYLFIIN